MGQLSELAFLCDMLTVPTEASHGQRPGPLRPFPGVARREQGTRLVLWMPLEAQHLY